MPVASCNQRGRKRHQCSVKPFSPTLVYELSMSCASHRVGEGSQAVLWQAQDRRRRTPTIHKQTHVTSVKNRHAQHLAVLKFWRPRTTREHHPRTQHQFFTSLTPLKINITANSSNKQQDTAPTCIRRTNTAAIHLNKQHDDIQPPEQLNKQYDNIQTRTARIARFERPRNSQNCSPQP